ncbi:MAG: ScaI family restriction endonuclease [Thaumarchaeota archaeon]|nr:ScaI family restriction endonuclease [Nitrososphaerota archaeon]
MEYSPYAGLNKSEWEDKTKELIDAHPLKENFIKKTVLDSWECILKTSIGKYKIGIDIFPKPQIMGFFLHELICLEISHFDPETWACEKKISDKDIVNLKNSHHSIEIKTSSNKTKIFGNKSYAQNTNKSKKIKTGYYVAVNFEKYTPTKIAPKILNVRFGWLDRDDWKGQKAQSGQQARLDVDVEKYKLLNI